MTTKHLIGYYSGGYTLSAGYSKLIIDESAHVAGVGVIAPFSATVVNHGAIDGSRNGVELEAGGSLINGSARNTDASITGYCGVYTFGVAGAANIANYGSIKATAAGVHLYGGGTITNGSAKDTSALIAGFSAGIRTTDSSTIVNFGTIAGESRTQGVGVALYRYGGDSLTNGSAKDTTALITGDYALYIWTDATVANFGTIRGLSRGGLNSGVDFFSEGLLTNGSALDTTALISGLLVQGYSASTILNFGTIDAVSFYTKGTLTNGSAADTKALIGRVYTDDAVPIVNFGTIGGATVNQGVLLREGASLTNGSAHDSIALIEGVNGVLANFGAETIANFGTIEALGGASVSLQSADSLIAEAGSTFNGEILGGGGRLALAGGGTGVLNGLGGTGTLSGAVEADFSGFSSYEIGAGGTWTLAGANMLDAGSILIDKGTLINTGALTISGKISIQASAEFELAGGNISTGPTGVANIFDDGLVTDTSGSESTVGAHMEDYGVVEVASGTLDFTSRLSGTGVLKIDAGATLEADAAASTLTATFDGAAATLALETPKAFHATLGGFAAGDVIDLLAIEATGASVNDSNQLVIVNGSETVAILQLSGNYIGVAFTTGSDGHGGTNVELVPADGVGRASVHGMAAAMAAMVAPADMAVLGRGLSTCLAPMLANPHIHLQ